MAKKARELEIDQDLAFQRREWTIQRAGWWLMLAFVVAAATGLFGGGFLSQATAGEPDGPLWVEYERFDRQGRVSRTQIHVRPPAGPGFQLRLNRDYFDAIRVERLTPEPETLEVGPSEVVFHFNLPTGATPFTLVIDAEPLSFGWHAATISSAGAVVTFSQLTYF